MFTCGSVFVQEDFKFRDETTGKKILVLLNRPTGNDPYVVVKTTSQQHSKPKTSGCIQKYHQAFFIAAKRPFFHKDTWIQLDDLFLLSNTHMRNKVHHIGDLDSKTADSIVNCFLKINEQDLSPKVRGYIIPPIAQGINALANKFNRR